MSQHRTHAQPARHPRLDDIPPLTVEEAFAAIFLGAVDSDGCVSPDEGRRAYQALQSMSLYKSVSSDGLQAIVGKVMELIEAYGIAPVVARAARTVPPDLRATAFANAADLVLSDRRVLHHERSLLDELQALLELDAETAGKILDVFAIKYRG